MVRRDQTFQKLWEVVSQLLFINKLSYKVSFFAHEIRESYKFQIYSIIHVGVVRPSQSDSKQRVRYISKMDLGMKLIFCM